MMKWLVDDACRLPIVLTSSIQERCEQPLSASSNNVILAAASASFVLNLHYLILVGPVRDSCRFLAIRCATCTCLVGDASRLFS